MDHPEDLEVDHPEDLEVDHPEDLEVDHLEDPKGGYPVLQVVDSDHLGRQEVAPEEGGKSDRPGSLGRNKIPG